MNVYADHNFLIYSAKEASAKVAEMLLPSPKPQHHSAPSESENEEVVFGTA
jgi:hypothetical protein